MKADALLEHCRQLIAAAAWKRCRPMEGRPSGRSGRRRLPRVGPGRVDPRGRHAAAGSSRRRRVSRADTRRCPIPVVRLLDRQVERSSWASRDWSRESTASSSRTSATSPGTSGASTGGISRTSSSSTCTCRRTRPRPPSPATQPPSSVDWRTDSRRPSGCRSPTPRSRRASRPTTRSAPGCAPSTRSGSRSPRSSRRPSSMRFSARRRWSPPRRVSDGSTPCWPSCLSARPSRATGCAS